MSTPRIRRRMRRRSGWLRAARRSLSSARSSSVIPREYRAKETFCLQTFCLHRKLSRRSAGSGGSPHAAHLTEDGGEAVAVALLVGDHVGDGVDQRQVGERLREVAEMATGLGLQLLGEEVEPAGRLEQPLAELAGPLALADLRERRDQPEGADQEGALLAAAARRRSRRPCSGARGRARSGPSAIASTVARMPRVVGRQEAEQRDQQQRGVERVGVVVLAEDAVADAALEDLGLELVGLRPPLVGDLVEARGRAPSARRGRPRPRSSASRRRSAAAPRATPRSPGRGAARRRSPLPPGSGSARRSAGVPLPLSAFSCR